MKIIALTKDEFDKFAYNHKYSTYYQTSSYADASRYDGLNTFYAGFVQNGELVGVTLFLYKTFYMFYKYAYAPRGFLIDYTDPELVKSVTTGLVKLLKKQHYAFIKIDPPIICSEKDKTGNVVYFSNTVNDILNTLKSNGYRHLGFNKYFETAKPRFNAFVTLQKDINTIYQELDDKVKRTIEESIDLGVEIRQDRLGNINDLYRFVGKKNLRRKKRYYQGIYNYFSKTNMIDIFFIDLNTDKNLENINKIYNQEEERNTSLASNIERIDLSVSEKEVYINEKMESDKRLAELKSGLIYSTKLSKKIDRKLTIGAAFVMKHNNGVEIIIDEFIEEFNKFNPKYVLIWELIQKYKNEGFAYINLNGVVGEFDKFSPKFRSLNSTKFSFNPSIIEYVGEFDLVINSSAYNKFLEMKKNPVKKK